MLAPRVLEHRRRQVEAAVHDVEPALARGTATSAPYPQPKSLRLKRPPAPVDHAQQLLEAKLLRFRRVPVDAPCGRPVLGEAAAVVALDGGRGSGQTGAFLVAKLFMYRGASGPVLKSRSRTVTA